MQFIKYLFIFAIICTIVKKVVRQIRYKTGAYYRCTHRSLSTISLKDGSRCEHDTYDALRKMERKGWKFLCDLYIPKEDGGTTEIDLLAITPGGVIVAECKEYSGEIYGSERDTYWRQEHDEVYSYRDVERQFYNPMKQNYGHIRHLKKILGEELDYKSLIVFSNRCNVYVGRHGDVNTRLGQVKNCLRHAKDLYAQMPDTLSKAEVNAMHEKLKQYTNVSRAVKKEHIRQCKTAGHY